MCATKWQTSFGASSIQELGIPDYQIYGNFMQFPWGYMGYDLIDKIIKIDIRAQRNPCF
jgi:hypothetical protein